MIEMRRLKNVVIFIQTILSFVLSRKIINIGRKFNKKVETYGSLVQNSRSFTPNINAK